MKDRKKTKNQLIEELAELRQRIEGLEWQDNSTSFSEHAWLGAGQEKQIIRDRLIEHVVYHDLGQRVLWANQAACESAGTRLEELQGRYCYEIWSQRSSPCEDCPVKRAHETGRPQSIKKTTPDGRSWDVKGYPVFNHDGHIMGMIEVALETTKLRRTEKALLESNALSSELQKTNEQLKHEIAEHKRTTDLLKKTSQKYLNIFENIQSVYCEATLDGIILEISPSVKDISDYKREELIGKSLRDMYVDPNERKKLVDKLLQNGKVRDYEVLLKDKDGVPIFCSTTAKLITDEYGKPEKIIGTLSDITERKRAEAAYKRSEAQMHRILDASIDRIRQVDKDLRIIWANKAGIATSDGTLEQLVGRTCYQFFTDRDFPCEACPTIKAKETGQIERAVMYKPKVRGLNSDSYWDVYCVPLKNESEEIDSYIQVSKNITEEKKAQDLIHNLSQQLLQSQERERHMISCELHDCIAQDLSALKIGIDTLLDGQPEIRETLSQKTKTLSEIVNKAIHGIRNLSYELRPPDLDETDIVTALRNYTEDFSEMSRMRIDFETNGSEGLNLDSESKIHLYRLAQEGLNNIHKHAHADKVSVRLGLSSATISLSIKDNGIGFDVKERERKLDNEKRLGLRSMRERVNLLGGRMKIKSRPGEGTKIIIKFPLKDKTHGAKNTHFDR